MPREVRHDTTGWMRPSCLFLLSVLAGGPLVWGVAALTRADGPLAVAGMTAAACVFPALTLLHLRRRGYRCGACGGRCAEADPPPGRWRYVCPRCDVAWDVDRPDGGAAA
jgi:hypothetical protein